MKSTRCNPSYGSQNIYRWRCHMLTWKKMTHSAVLVMYHTLQLPNIDWRAWGILHSSYVFHFISTSTLSPPFGCWEPKFSLLIFTPVHTCSSVTNTARNCHTHAKHKSQKWSHDSDLTEQNLHVFLCKTKCFQIDSSQLSPHGVWWEIDLVSQRPQHVNVRQDLTLLKKYCCSSVDRFLALSVEMTDWILVKTLFWRDLQGNKKMSGNVDMSGYSITLQRCSKDVNVERKIQQTLQCLANLKYASEGQIWTSCKTPSNL